MSFMLTLSFCYKCPDMGLLPSELNLRRIKNLRTTPRRIHPNLHQPTDRLRTLIRTHRPPTLPIRFYVLFPSTPKPLRKNVLKAYYLTMVP